MFRAATVLRGANGDADGASLCTGGAVGLMSFALYSFLSFSSQASLRRTHDQRRRRSAASSLSYNLRSAGAAGAPGPAGLAGGASVAAGSDVASAWQRKGAGAGTGYSGLAVPAQGHCYFTRLAANGNQRSQRATKARSGSWQQRMRVCGEKGARNQQTIAGPTSVFKRSAGDTRACTGPNAPEKDQRPKIIGVGRLRSEQTD